MNTISIKFRFVTISYYSECQKQTGQKGKTKLIKLCSTSSQTRLSCQRRRAALAVSIGCVCRSKGGLALQGLLPTVVETLIAVARQSSGLVAFWAVHGLWLTANAAGLSFLSHVKVKPAAL